MALVMAYAGAKALKKAHDQKRARDMEDDEPDWGMDSPLMRATARRCGLTYSQGTLSPWTGTMRSLRKID